MTNYLIIDDEYIANDIINKYCDLLPNMKHIKSSYDALQALSFLGENSVDLVFLDLNMPKLKGFEFLRTLTKPPKIIVTTGYKEFALEGYELNIVDYLLKPFSFERFLKAVNKAIIPQEQSKSVVAGNESKTKKTVFIRDNKRHIQVEVDDILYFESSGNYVKVVTKKRNITVRSKLMDLLENLPKDQYVGVHKSFVVSKKHITSVEGNRVYIGDSEIPIGRVYKLNVSKILD